MTRGSEASVSAVFVAVLLAYGLGVYDERLFPGDTVVPVNFSEAVLWVLVLFDAGFVAGLVAIARRPDARS